MDNKYTYGISIPKQLEEPKRLRQFWRLVVAFLIVLILLLTSISLACIFCLWNSVYHTFHTGLVGVIDVKPASVLDSTTGSPEKLMRRVEHMIFNHPFDGLASYDRLMVIDLRGADLPMACRTYPKTEIVLLETLFGFAHPRCSTVASDLRNRINYAQNMYIDSREGHAAPVDFVYLAMPIDGINAWLDDLKDQLRRDGWTGVKASSDLALNGMIGWKLLSEIEEAIMGSAQTVVPDLYEA